MAKAKKKNTTKNGKPVQRRGRPVLGTLTIRAPRDVVARAKKRADAEDSSVSRVVRSLLRAYADGAK